MAVNDRTSGCVHGDCKDPSSCPLFAEDVAGVKIALTDASI